MRCTECSKTGNRTAGLRTAPPSPSTRSFDAPSLTRRQRVLCTRRLAKSAMDITTCTCASADRPPSDAVSETGTMICWPSMLLLSAQRPRSAPREPCLMARASFATSFRISQHVAGCGGSALAGGIYVSQIATPPGAGRFRGWNSEDQCSDLRFQISESRFQISDFSIQNSEFRIQISDFRIQNSEFRFQISDFRFQISDFKHETPFQWFQILTFHYFGSTSPNANR